MGWIPPHPPDHDVDPRPRQTSRNPAPKGRISPVFWGLRCKVVGGWGGSAHYPDPTAQSAAASGPATCATRGRPGRLPGPSSQLSLPKPPKFAKIFFFSQQLLSVEGERGARGGVSAIGCADVSHVRCPLRYHRPCPLAEVLTDSMGVDSTCSMKGQLALRGTSGPYRSLQSSGRVWLSQTASSFSQPHGPARTSVLTLREDLFRRARTTHWP